MTDCKWNLGGCNGCPRYKPVARPKAFAHGCETCGNFCGKIPYRVTFAEAVLLMASVIGELLETIRKLGFSDEALLEWGSTDEGFFVKAIEGNNVQVIRL